MKVTKVLFCISFLLCSIYVSAQNASLNMTRLSSFDPTSEDYNDIWGIEIGGNQYAIMGSVNNIYIIDVTDCSNPIQKAVLSPPGNSSIWRDFKTYDGYIFGVCESCVEGLVVIDANVLPSGTPTIGTQTLAFFNKAHNIYIDGNYLYAVGTEVAPEGVVILDISSPLSPTLVANIDFDIVANGVNTIGDYYVHDINVNNGIAYCSHGKLGEFIAWDVADFAAISMLGSYVTGNYTHSSWNTEDGKYAYVAEEVPTGKPLRIIDLLDASGNIDMMQQGTFSHSIDPGNSTPHNVFVKADTLFVSNYHDGVKLYDISDPTDPTILGYYDTYPTIGYSGYEGAWGVYPYLSSGCIIGSDISTGLYVMKYSVALGLEWGDFSVERSVKNSSLLNWSTLSEINTKEFTVLRSIDGHNFIPLGNLPAMNNSSRHNRYSFEDLNPHSGKNYYKLRLTDHDGTIDYSEIRAIEFNDEHKSFSLYPSLVYNQELAISGPFAADDYRLIVFSPEGKSFTITSNLENNVAKLRFPENLPSGQYYVQILKSGQIIETLSFIKV